MKNHKLTSVLFACLLFICQVTTAFAAGNFDNHWASQALNKWQNYGIISVDENVNFSPDNTITRAEFATLLDKIMEYQVTSQNNFVDLSNAWYTDAILGTNAAGIINGYEDLTIRPNANVTRQEAIVAFARLIDLNVYNAPTANYTDISSVGSWALPSVNAMTNKNYISGYNNILRPNDDITRAEVITIINNIFSSYIYESGTYTEDISGCAIISADDVTLNNMTVNGDIIIAEGVGNGNIELDNVKVNGCLIVRGGGENSIIIKGNSTISNISVAHQNSKVGLSIEDSSQVSSITITDKSDTVKIEGKVDTVYIDGNDTTVEITDSVDTIEVSDTANFAKLTLAKNAIVKNIKIKSNNVTVNTYGTVTNIDVIGSNVLLIATDGSIVESITTSGSNTTVSGNGTVNKVEVLEGATGAKIETHNTKIENNSSSDVTISDGSTIKPNESGNSSISGENSSGSSGGGSGNSGDGDNNNQITTSATVSTLTELETALNDTNIKTITITGEIKVGSLELPTENTNDLTTISNITDITITKSINIPEYKSVTISNNATLTIAPDGLLTSSGTLIVDGILAVYTDANAKNEFTDNIVYTTLGNTTINGNLNIYKNSSNNCSTTVKITTGNTLTISGSVTGSLSSDAVIPDFAYLNIKQGGTLNNSQLASGEYVYVGADWVPYVVQDVQFRPNSGSGKEGSSVDDFKYQNAYSKTGLTLNGSNGAYTFDVNAQALANFVKSNGTWAKNTTDENQIAYHLTLPSESVSPNALYAGIQLDKQGEEDYVTGYVAIGTNDYELNIDKSLESDSVSGNGADIYNSQYIHYVPYAYANGSTAMDTTLSYITIWRKGGQNGTATRVSYCKLNRITTPTTESVIVYNQETLDIALQSKKSEIIINALGDNLNTGEVELTNSTNISTPLFISRNVNFKIGANATLTLNNIESSHGKIIGTDETSVIIASSAIECADGINEAGTYIWSGNDWAKVHTITFDLNYDDAPILETRTTNLDGKLTALPEVANREGYEFIGWYDTPTDGNKIEIDNEYNSFNTDCILYAHWNPIEIDVSTQPDNQTYTNIIDDNNEYISSEDTILTGDTDKTLNANDESLTDIEIVET